MPTIPLDDGYTVELQFTPEGMEEFCADGLRCAKSAREAAEATHG